VWWRGDPDVPPVIRRQHADIIYLFRNEGIGVKKKKKKNGCDLIKGVVAACV
jgi:hypothetical protein